jgi:peptidoglycan/xylan/chitin deacetylase (PgdA/CDA1 family)
MLRVLGAAARTGGRHVVWRGVREVLATEQRHGVRSSWFILCGTPTFATMRAGDLTYRAESALARRILAALRDAGHEIGLHGSFATSEEHALFAAQRARLAALAGTNGSGVRQHYLRMRPGDTHRGMADAGFAFDSTYGFADRNGFRLGVADVVPVWDDAARAPLPLDEAPFIWMDRALSKYAGVERPDAWIDDALDLADRVRTVDGLWVGIWHPNLTPALGYPGAPSAYARLVAGLVERDAYLAPLGEIVAWRRARRAARATAIGADGAVSLALPLPAPPGTRIAVESAAGDPVEVHVDR